MLVINDKPVRMVPMAIQMRVIERQVFVAMLEGVRIVGWPKPQHRHHTCSGQSIGYY